MSFKLKSPAKTLTLVCLAIALTSGYYGNTWHSAADDMQASVEKMQQDQSAADTARAALSKVLVNQDTVSYKLQDTVSAVLLELFNSRVEHGVRLTNAVPGKAGIGGGFSNLAALGEKIPDTNIQSVRINMSGTYEDYQGLIAYIQDLQKYPVSVVHLKVSGQAFDVALRVYGL